MGVKSSELYPETEHCLVAQNFSPVFAFADPQVFSVQYKFIKP